MLFSFEEATILGEKRSFVLEEKQTNNTPFVRITTLL